MQNLDILTIQIYKWIGRVKQMYIESKIESRFGNDESNLVLFYTVFVIVSIFPWK